MAKPSRHSRLGSSFGCRHARARRLRAESKAMCWSIVNGYTQFTDYDWGDIIMSSSSAWKQPKRRGRASCTCRARVRVRVCVVGMRRGGARRTLCGRPAQEPLREGLGAALWDGDVPSGCEKRGPSMKGWPPLPPETTETARRSPSRTTYILVERLILGARPQCRGPRRAAAQDVQIARG